MDPLFSPDGTYRVDLHEFEMKMSHWVANPVVTHLPSGQVLLDLTDTMWDAVATFEDDGRVTLDLREYPGSTPGFKATIDFDTLDVRTLPFRAPPDASPQHMTLEQLLKSLAPRKALPTAVRARRRALDRQHAQDEALRAASQRQNADHDERQRQAQAARQSAQADRSAELERRQTARRMRREAGDAYQFVLARAGLGSASLAPTHAIAPAPGASASPRALRSQTIAGFVLTLGAIGAALLALWAIAWLLAERSPLHAAPAWLAWSIGSLLAAGVVIGVPMILLIWGFRNFRG